MYNLFTYRGKMRINGKIADDFYYKQKEGIFAHVLMRTRFVSIREKVE